MEYNLTNVEKIEVINKNIIITYTDNTKHTITVEDNVKVTFTKDLKNENDSPIVDHCI
jgi:hypothetical protein